MDYDLERFKRAQEAAYDNALREVRGGRKQSHWIWYIFPQLRGLGRSSMSDYYGISGLEEAKAYLADAVLGARLIEISEALLEQQERSAGRIFGYPDVMKVQSCMTLFQAASDDPDTVFSHVLDVFYQGEKDRLTLEMLSE